MGVGDQCKGGKMLFWVFELVCFLVAVVAVLGGIVFLKKKEFAETVVDKRVAARVEQEYVAALLRKRHDIDNPPEVLVEETKANPGARKIGDDESEEAEESVLEDGEKDEKKKGLLSKLGSSANAGVDFVTMRKKKKEGE